jgi:hypothetical protein
VSKKNIFKFVEKYDDTLPTSERQGTYNAFEKHYLNTNFKKIIIICQNNNIITLI